VIFEEKDIEQILGIVQAELDRRALPAVMPELLTYKAAAEMLSEADPERPITSVMLAALAYKAPGFPVCQFGPQTYRVDKRRLIEWVAKGGLFSSDDATP
jgi:hypothetical protein